MVAVWFLSLIILEGEPSLYDCLILLRWWAILSQQQLHRLEFWFCCFFLCFCWGVSCLINQSTVMMDEDCTIPVILQVFPCLLPIKFCVMQCASFLYTCWCSMWMRFLLIADPCVSPLSACLPCGLSPLIVHSSTTKTVINPYPCYIPH